MAKNYYDITVALAGIAQSARLVQQLAHNGQCDNDALSVSLKSILVTDSPSTLAVFGHESDLNVGLDTLPCVLTNNRQELSAEITRYVLSLMVLERKLSGNPQALNELSNRIGQLDRQLAHFDIESETIISSLASIYVDVVSPLGPRIQVTGSPEALQKPLVQAKVRAALLAGIRATVLWQQVGGSRLQFMFSRNRLLQQAREIVAHR
ncbi:high frequency lysogenization protein HflD [Budviciaceae bacterium BWR-B9]|uniref:High frequency lysogenization protein HflD homolog n=1 Tax=Limnobaculum allomyrinae TaxID=2791986 RepID=A0ABS1ISZ7_9GAMM|nr:MULTISPECIES: high frequency lysogenization protein HflD [Limnobaculum]MBK5144691.1 high frequency lysogenization protein HflD [Limnobaculum allomyrinae]MBV7692354.1 high frequency lysogenization protein HflD [Limnobaculum sp. M2-1]